MSKVATTYKYTGKIISYEVLDNGYSLYLGDSEDTWITQTGSQAKLYAPSGTYSANALAHIQSVATNATDNVTEIEDAVIEIKETYNKIKEDFEEVSNNSATFSETQPTSPFNTLWISPEDGEEVIPQINDETISKEDTWSSEKINKETSELKETLSDINTELYGFTPKLANISGEGWKLNEDGSWARDTDYTTPQYAVTEGENIYLHSNNIYKFEMGIAGIAVGSVGSNYDGFIKVPNSATYIAVCKLSTDKVSGVYNASSLIDAKAERIASGASLSIHAVGGYLNTKGKFIDTDSFVSSVTDLIKCSYGDVFYYYGHSSSAVVACMFFDSVGNILQSYSTTGNTGYQSIVFTAPVDSCSVIFTSYNVTEAGYSVTGDVPSLVVTQKTRYESALSLKKWYVCGDSFSAGGYEQEGGHTFTSGKYFRKNKVYPYFIGDRTNCDVINLARGGMTLGKISTNSLSFTDVSCESNYTKIDTDADIVTLYFGINDNGYNIPVGEIDDDSNSTFYGAYNIVLQYLLTTLTHGHIGIIVSNALPEAYVNATIAIAKKWGIPYLDLNYDDSVPLMNGSLRPSASNEVKELRNTQFRISSTNHHPNDKAHEYESYFIENWLKTL